MNSSNQSPNINYIVPVMGNKPELINLYHKTLLDRAKKCKNNDSNCKHQVYCIIDSVASAELGDERIMELHEAGVIFCNMQVFLKDFEEKIDNVDNNIVSLSNIAKTLLKKKKYANNADYIRLMACDDRMGLGRKGDIQVLVDGDFEPKLISDKYIKEIESTTRDSNVADLSRIPIHNAQGLKNGFFYAHLWNNYSFGLNYDKRELLESPSLLGAISLETGPHIRICGKENFADYSLYFTNGCKLPADRLYIENYIDQSLDQYPEMLLWAYQATLPQITKQNVIPANAFYDSLTRSDNWAKQGVQPARCENITLDNIPYHSNFIIQPEIRQLECNPHRSNAIEASVQRFQKKWRPDKSYLRQTGKEIPTEEVPLTNFKKIPNHSEWGNASNISRLEETATELNNKKAVKKYTRSTIFL